MNKKFLVIILFILNILAWSYYFIYHTNIYNAWFLELEDSEELTTFKDNGDLKINFYDNSNGNLVIIKTPTNKNILINSGNILEIKKYIKENNLFFIDKIFLTNNKNESTNGLQDLLRIIAVGEIIAGSPYFVFNHPEIGYTSPKQGETIYVDPYLNITAFFAIDSIGEKFGDMFLLITYNDIEILFTTSNGQEEQTALVDQVDLGNIDILEYPKMDYRQNISEAFMRKIKPRYLIVRSSSIFKGDFIDMNAWNVFDQNKFYVKYVNADKKLMLVTNGEKLEF